MKPGRRGRPSATPRRADRLHVPGCLRRMRRGLGAPRALRKPEIGLDCTGAGEGTLRARHGRRIAGRRQRSSGSAAVSEPSRPASRSRSRSAGSGSAAACPWRLRSPRRSQRSKASSAAGAAGAIPRAGGVVAFPPAAGSVVARRDVLFRMALGPFRARFRVANAGWTGRAQSVPRSAVASRPPPRRRARSRPAAPRSPHLPGKRASPDIEGRS